MSGTVIPGPGAQMPLFDELPAVAPKGQTPAQRIVGAWIDECTRVGAPRPLTRRLKAVAKAVKEFTEDGAEPGHILAGILEWDRRDMSLSVLADFVDAERKRGHVRPFLGHRQEQSDASFARSLERMRAADAADRKGVTG